jgi:hypothetical protein
MPMVSRITASARLTITSIDGVSAYIANAGLMISCRVGKYNLANTPPRDSARWQAFPVWPTGPPSATAMASTVASRSTH